MRTSETTSGDRAAATEKAASPFFAQKAAGQGQKPPTFFGPRTVQPKLTVNQPDDDHEREADAVADRVMRMSEASLPSAVVQRQVEGIVQRDGPPTGGNGTPAPVTPPAASGDDKAKDKPTGYAWPWQAVSPLLLDFPKRWSGAYRNRNTSGFPLLSFDVSPELALAQWKAMQNLYLAQMLSATSPYAKVDFGKGLEMVEALSGNKDTYLHLASMALRYDLPKLLKTDLPDAAKANPSWTALYALLAQGGALGYGHLTKDKLDPVSVLKLATDSYTTAPPGLTRPFNYGNTPDPRWGGYPFRRLPGDLKLEFNNLYSDKADQFDMGAGFNVASLLSGYPSNPKERKQYRGPELYPFGSYQHQWAAEGDTAAKQPHTWMAGAYGGYGGVGGLLLGGQRRGEKEEDYMRGMLTAGPFGPLSMLQVGGEMSRRPEFGGDWRARWDAALQLNLIDSAQWRLGLGANVGGLPEQGGSPGAVDFGGAVNLDHLQSPWRFGLSFGAMRRHQDPFDARSTELTSLKAGLKLFDFLQINAEYHQASGGDPSSGLPKSDFRLIPTLTFPLPSSKPTVHRKCADCKQEEEKETVQLKPGSNALQPSANWGGQSAPPTVHEALSGSGQPLDGGARSFMENRFGTDFSQVRVHTQGQAAASAGQINARAYTSGHHIVFGSGEYRPDTDTGKRLLAHELVHTVQQGAVKQNVQRQPAAPPPITDLSTVPAVDRRQIQFSTVAVPDSLISQLNSVFATNPSLTGGATTSFPAPGTVHFDANIPAAPSVTGYDVRRGLTSVAGWLSSHSNILPQNHTVSVLLDLTTFGGANAIYRFTRFDLGTGTAATDEVLIEQSSAAPSAAPTVTLPTAPATGPTTFQVGGQTFNLGTGWLQTDFNLLAQALGMLNATMLTQAAGLTFRRAGTVSGDPEAGHYDDSNNSITIRDNAFRTNHARYGSSAEAVRIVLHEVAHALDRAILNRAWQQYQSTHNAAHLNVRSLSGLTYRLDATTGDYETVEGTATTAFRTAVQADRAAAGGRTMPTGVTTYGETNWEESFAEAYSYYMTDRTAFRLLRPRTAAYFDTQFP